MMTDQTELPPPSEGVCLLLGCSALMASVVAGDPTEQADAVWVRISELMVSSAQRAHTATLETILEMTAIAHGLHAAAARLRDAGREQRANEVAEMGQLFLTYVADDAMDVATALAAADELDDGMTVH